jgi:hypothetical protein
MKASTIGAGLVQDPPPPRGAAIMQRTISRRKDAR